MPSGKKTPFKLLPIFEATHNFREIAKQLVLLEDHLSHSRKRCQDCIRKHFVTAEALAEEAVSLAGADRESREIASELAEALRDIGVEYSLRRIPAEVTASALRTLRKPLLKASYTHVKETPKGRRGRRGRSRARRRP